MPHHLGHGSQVSTFAEQGGRKQVPQVVHTSRVGDSGSLTGMLERLSDRRQLPSHVLDDIFGLARRFLLLQTLQEGGIDRDRPIGLGFGSVDAHSAGGEIDVLPPQRQELRFPRSRAQVEAHLHSPSQVRFGTGHDLLRVVQGQLQVPGLDLGLFPVFQRVDFGQAIVDAKVEDETQIITVLIHRVLRSGLLGGAADAFEVQDEWNHVALVGQGVDRLVTDHGDELVFQQPFDVADVLIRPSRCTHVIQVTVPKLEQGDPDRFLSEDFSRGRIRRADGLDHLD